MSESPATVDDRDTAAALDSEANSVVDFDFGARLEGKAARTYRQLVASCREVLRESTNFTVNDVANHAGMATATVYTYFPTKSHLLAAAFDDLLADGFRITSEELDIAAVLTDGLEAVIGRMLRRTSAAYRRDGRLMSLALSEMNHEPVLRSIMRRHEIAGLERIERFLVLCREAGRISAEQPRDLAVASLLIMESITSPTLGRADNPSVVASYLVSAVCAIMRGGLPSDSADASHSG